MFEVKETGQRAESWKSLFVLFLSIHDLTTTLLFRPKYILRRLNLGMKFRARDTKVMA
jgi:hypothetical protein